MRLDFLNWLVTAFWTTGLLALLVFIFRKSVLELLTRSISHRFDRNIESFKSEVRQTEAELRTAVESRETEITALRNNLLSMRNDRRSELERRRITALESVWKATQEHMQLTMLIEFMKTIDVIKAIEQSKEVNVQEYFRIVSKSCGLDDFLESGKTKNLTTDRLYVSPKLWSWYSLYKFIFMDAAIRLKFIQMAVGDPKILRDGKLTQMTLELMPNMKDGFDKFGDTYAYYCIDQIQETLVSLIIQEMNGEEIDEAELKKSQEISRLVRADSISNQTPKAPASVLKDS